ncbi:MAG: hypothetical protein QNJ97_07435 [Myxococcota bacterium]|nr:hypothetical protein [Myxococcota bacterium]
MASNRNVWVSYLRVSTSEQAEKDLSIPAQRESVAAYVSRGGRTDRTSGGRTDHYNRIK